MPLKQIPIPEFEVEIPNEMSLFLDEAEDRIDWYQHEMGEQLNSAFEPADYQEVAEHLIWMQSQFFKEGTTFLEWGSGFGVTAAIASMLNFKSYGVELDSMLVDQSKKLADEFGLQVQFRRGDFLNEENDDEETVSAKNADVLYVYPWPGEAQRIRKLAGEILKPGAYLLCYLGFMDIQMFQKTEP